MKFKNFIFATIIFMIFGMITYYANTEGLALPLEVAIITLSHSLIMSILLNFFFIFSFLTAEKKLEISKAKRSLCIFGEIIIPVLFCIIFAEYNIINDGKFWEFNWSYYFLLGAVIICLIIFLLVRKFDLSSLKVIIIKEVVTDLDPYLFLILVTEKKIFTKKYSFGFFHQNLSVIPLTLSYELEQIYFKFLEMPDGIKIPIDKPTMSPKILFRFDFSNMSPKDIDEAYKKFLENQENIVKAISCRIKTIAMEKTINNFFGIIGEISMKEECSDIFIEYPFIKTATLDCKFYQKLVLK